MEKPRREENARKCCIMFRFALLVSTLTLTGFFVETEAKAHTSLIKRCSCRPSVPLEQLDHKNALDRMDFEWEVTQRVHILSHGCPTEKLHLT